MKGVNCSETFRPRGSLCQSQNSFVTDETPRGRNVSSLLCHCSTRLPFEKVLLETLVKGSARNIWSHV